MSGEERGYNARHYGDVEVSDGVGYCRRCDDHLCPRCDCGLCLDDGCFSTEEICHSVKMSVHLDGVYLSLSNDLQNLWHRHAVLTGV